MSEITEPLTMTVKRAADMLGVGRTTIYQLLSEERLARVKIGRRTLITFESVKALIS